MPAPRARRRLCLAWRLIARSCSSRICTTRGRTRTLGQHADGRTDRLLTSFTLMTVLVQPNGLASFTPMSWPDSPTPAHPSQLTPPSPCPPPNLPLTHCLRVSSVSGRAGALEHKRVSTPLILHFNGPAKVIFEREWTLPWDATSGKTPVLLLIEGLRRGKSQRERWRRRPGLRRTSPSSIRGFAALTVKARCATAATFRGEHQTRACTERKQARSHRP